jgi:AraC-like DNA-binding protein
MSAEPEEFQRARIQKALDAIEAGLRQPFDMGELARSSSYSSSRFQELFARFVHEPVFEYVRKRRLTAALTDLATRKESVASIARSYGYRSARAFSRAFRRLHGISPGEYRRTRCPTRGLRPAVVSPNPATPQIQLFQTSRVAERQWRIVVRLSAPDLRPEAVLLGVFRSDPVLSFRREAASPRTPQRITRLVERFGARRSALKHAIAVTRSALWDDLFSELPGDEVYLLAGQSLGGIPAVVTSEDVGGDRWIATKTTGDLHDPYCWAVCFSANAGSVQEIDLDDRNRFDLAGCFDTAIDRQKLP